MSLVAQRNWFDWIYGLMFCLFFLFFLQTPLYYLLRIDCFCSIKPWLFLQLDFQQSQIVEWVFYQKQVISQGAAIHCILLYWFTAQNDANINHLLFVWCFFFVPIMHPPRLSQNHCILPRVSQYPWIPPPVWANGMKSHQGLYEWWLIYYTIDEFQT